MEQFKKWLLTDEGQILVGDYRAEAAWRAALEWTIEEIIGCLSPQDAIEILREELEGGAE